MEQENWDGEVKASKPILFKSWNLIAAAKKTNSVLIASGQQFKG